MHIIKTMLNSSPKLKIRKWSPRSPQASNCYCTSCSSIPCCPSCQPSKVCCINTRSAFEPTLVNENGRTLCNVQVFLLPLHRLPPPRILLHLLHEKSGIPKPRKQGSGYFFGPLNFHYSHSFFQGSWWWLPWRTPWRCRGSNCFTHP